MNDDQRLLANAYLDGEVTADERARAEADPEVAAEVERIRAVRDAIRVTDPPDEARREAAIAAALDAFEVRPAATIATTPDVPVAPPVSLDARRRARVMRPLAAAAAVVLVVAGGIVLLRDGRDDETDDAASSATLLAERAAATEAAPEDADEAAGELEAAATAPAPAATDAAADTLAAAGGSDQVAPDAAVEEPSVLRSPEDLAAFAAATARPLTESTTRDGVPLGCVLGELVGTAVYQRDGQAVDVVVFVEGSEAIAADTSTCEVVARAQLP